MKNGNQLLQFMLGLPSYQFLDDEDFGCKYTPKQQGKDYNSSKIVLNAKAEHTDVLSIEFYHVFIKEPSV